MKQAQASWRIHKRWKQRQRRRASDNVILPMPFSQYWEIAEWTSRQALGHEQDETLPRDLAATLRQKQIDPKHWRAAVINFGHWFHRAVGSTSHLAGILERLNRRWIQGIGHCRDVFT